MKKVHTKEGSRQAAELEAMGQLTPMPIPDDESLSHWSQVENMENDIQNLHNANEQLHQRMAQMEACMAQILTVLQSGPHGALSQENTN